MNKTSFDYAAIDTNVFEQLFNPSANSSNHIDKLLERLMLCHNTKLIVDCGKRIEGEYGRRLRKRIAQTNHTVPNRRQILNYFFVRQKYVRVRVKDDNLMKKIKKPPIEISGTDAIFVYVAFKKGEILITNDRKDIIDKGNRTEFRRKELRKLLKSLRISKSADILTSEEAVKVC